MSNPNEPKLEKLDELKEKLSQKRQAPQIPQAAPPLPSLNQMMSFEEKITYTFLHNKEVGSIHFDRSRREIYYKGHNLKNMELESGQLRMLEKMRALLKSDPKWKNFSEEYSQTLDKFLMGKKKTPSP